MNYKYLILLVIGVNATALFSGVMGPDGTLYAYIAKQMVQHHDFINLYNNTDWLDKPHFPFWITAVSFKIFGINSFAYKFPAFLFWLGGLYYLFRLGEQLYNRQVAAIAVIVYGTALQAAVGLFDVRAEHYLTAVSIAAIYYLYRVYLNGKWTAVLMAAVFSACAVMTKGIFFLSAIVSGLATLTVISKDWAQLTKFRWYGYLLLTAVFILPELYCLYTQFDLHPEKVVYGKTNVSGLRFFFWDSQFGRFLNTGPIRGKGDKLFFLHTMLWAFLPWCILFYAAIIHFFSAKKAMARKDEWIIIGSLAYTFLIFSLSKFQLPHYVITFLPQAALITADFITITENKKGIGKWIILQKVLLALCLVFITGTSLLFGLNGSLLITLIAVAATFTIIIYIRKRTAFSLTATGVAFFVLLHLFLNLSFYPALLRYQSGEVAAKWCNDHLPKSQVDLFGTDDYSFKFYLKQPVIFRDSVPIELASNAKVRFFFATKYYADSLHRAGFNTHIEKSFHDFHISRLNLRFINKRSRFRTLDTTVLLSVAGNINMSETRP